MAEGFMDTSVRGLRAASEDNLIALYQRVSEEVSRRSYLRDCRARVMELVEAYEQSVTFVEAKDIKSLAQGATIGPGEILRIGQDFYKNVSHAWLDPFKAGPTNFVAGWEKQAGGVA